MRQLALRVGLTVILLVSLLGLVGAAPRQGEPPQPPQGGPPSPFFPDIFSGAATLLGQPAPGGVTLVACVMSCPTWQSGPADTATGGQYRDLLINPADESLRGQTISFYLVNQYGRVRARETHVFEASKNVVRLNLTFTQALPTEPPPTPTPTLTPTPAPTVTPTPTNTPNPTPTASLPMVGDPAVAQAPQWALALGLGALGIGAGLLLVYRRRDRLSR